MCVFENRVRYTMCDVEFVRVIDKELLVPRWYSNEVRFGSTIIYRVVDMVATNSSESAVTASKKCTDDDAQSCLNPAKYLFQVSKLTDSLYLCGACAIRANTFEQYGITCVINCTTRTELSDPPLPDSVTTYLRIPVLDSPNTDLRRYFLRIANIIKKVESDGGRTLVHCIAGVSRSASLCLAYIMKYHDLSLRDAYEFVEKRRPCINPNNAFFEQLIDFEIELRGGIPSISMILDAASESHIPDIYFSTSSGRKCDNKLSCQLKPCQKRPAEYYMDQQAWPTRLRPALRDEGFDFEVEKPLSPGGALVIPSDWRFEPIGKEYSSAIVSRARSVSDETKEVLQNAAEIIAPVLFPTPQLLRDKPSQLASSVLVYDPSSDRKAYPKTVCKEQNLRNFVNILRGGLPNGLMLFKHAPQKRLYLYIGDEIWQWDGDTEIGLKVISKTVTEHVEDNVFLCWNNDLRRYLMVTVHPKKCVLDWEADFDKPIITQLLNDAKKERILAYNSTACSTLTMHLETAKLAVVPT